MLRALLVSTLLLQAVVSGASTTGPEGVTLINQNWLFGGEYTTGSEAPGFDDSGFQQVTIPHIVTPLGWEQWDNNTWNKVWIYRRHFDLPSGDSGRTFIDFDSVLTVTTAVINGQKLATHEGGYLPFSYEITDYVKETGNIIAVIVDARWSYVNPEGSPAGPDSIDYLEPGGINRDVSLRTVPSSFISDVFAKPVNVLSNSRHVVVEATIDSAKAPGQIKINSQLQDAGDVLSHTTEEWKISQPGNSTFTLNISAPNVKLWSPSSPSLYQVVTSLTVDDHVVHTFIRNIGFREANFTTDGFFLNGDRFQIFGLDRHQLFPYIGMSASERLQKRDAEILKELNCNMVRCSHYPQSPHFLDMCDQLGIMVWQEVPGWQFIGNASWQQHVVSDVHDMVIRDRSRPSIILWGTQVNESPREPDLYTQTKNVAHALDDSRQTSGSETSQSLVNWVGDVFAYDDYHSKDGNAILLPPLTTVPYLITESVGALDGPKYFRWIDQQEVVQDQAKLHAQVHDIAASNNSYSGLLGWCAIDYQSLNGNIYENVKWPGVIDTFRVYKPGAAFYLTQGDPANGALIEPAFYWDFGSFSPVTTLGDNATIWSNCDTLEAYINGGHYATLSPDTANFSHTAHPPFYLDTTKLNTTATLPELRLEGYVSGKKVASRTFSGSTVGDHIQITLNDPKLEADGIDSTLISFRAVDKYGNPRPYASGNATISIRGPGEWVGSKFANDVFPLSDNGGVGGAVIRTVAGQTGTIVLEVSHATLGSDTVQIQAV
ncbi:beta-galactosidase [Penicillium riverlandense]|uniref:beta-galactosidase n=1 Tax=Penicillium riverlandense TaxID=1903569 RepID=UPI002548ACE5|nr:beta-galactosidase [Penicillium riverlandense]KAJ5832486.1 beta-galactosidase [Penicillium riverlandense]